MENLNDFLNYDFRFGETVHITVKTILVVLIVFVVTAILLKLIRKLATRKLPSEDRLKFTSVFSFTRYFIYLVVLLVTMDNMGVNVTAIFAASAASSYPMVKLSPMGKTAKLSFAHFGINCISRVRAVSPL